MAHKDASNLKRSPMEWTKKVLIIVLVGVVFIFFAIAVWLQWAQSTPITIAIYGDTNNTPVRFQRRLEQLLGQSVQFEDAACILDLETKKGCPTTIARVEIGNAFKALRIKSGVRRLAQEEGLDILVE